MWNEILNSALPTITTILLILSILAFVKIIKALCKKINLDSEIKELDSIEDYIRRVIYSCVQGTNQAFVNSLKEDGEFTDEKQKEAFHITYSAVRLILDNMLTEINKSPEADRIYITNLIEEAVKMCKENNTYTPYIDTRSLLDTTEDLDSILAISDDNTNLESILSDSTVINETQTYYSINENK